jgi:hypothetical protein
VAHCGHRAQPEIDPEPPPAGDRGPHLPRLAGRWPRRDEGPRGYPTGRPRHHCRQRQDRQHQAGLCVRPEPDAGAHATRRLTTKRDARNRSGQPWLSSLSRDAWQTSSALRSWHQFTLDGCIARLPRRAAVSQLTLEADTAGTGSCAVAGTAATLATGTQVAHDIAGARAATTVRPDDAVCVATRYGRGADPAAALLATATVGKVGLALARERRWCDATATLTRARGAPGPLRLRLALALLADRAMLGLVALTLLARLALGATRLALAARWGIVSLGETEDARGAAEGQREGAALTASA